MSSASASPRPLGMAEFTAHLMPFQPSQRLAVAFSGGPDSLALLWLAARWARQSAKREVIALTVDHGLRAESAKEARLAARMAKALGVHHRILLWRGEKPDTGLQAAARAARYRLLIEACKAENIQDLLVAHHLEDQAETFLLRLARGSGVDGLAAMAGSREVGGVRLLRPLLDVPRARLSATLEKAKLQAIIDPSNANERFERVKVRHLMAELARLGLDAARLAATAGHMARARLALEVATRVLLAEHAVLMPSGYVEADANALVAAPEEISLRTLSEILKCVGASLYPPRFDALRSVYLALKQGELFRARTLNGCRIFCQGKQLFVMRELAAALDAEPLRLRSGQSGIWDGRFEASFSHASASFGPIEIRALGAEGLAILKAKEGFVVNVHKAAAASVPAFWRGGKLVAVPHLGVVSPKVAVEISVIGRGFFAVGG